MKNISMTEANRSFAKIAHRAAKGEVFGLTVRGKVIARIVPETDYNDIALAIRRRVHLESLRDRPTMNLPKLSREDMYERE
jgi:antitoxin (DNA-binding transcriptional repressor) of toxin-antitoxin stability system